MALTIHLDSNTFSAYLRGNSDAVLVFERAPALAMSPVVIGELKCGFALGSRAQRNLEVLREVLDSPRVLVPPVDDAVTDRYAAIFKQLRRDGRPIPTNDMWIAAALLRRVEEALFTLDAHFGWIDGLKVVHNAADFEKLVRQ